MIDKIYILRRAQMEGLVHNMREQVAIRSNIIPASIKKDVIIFDKIGIVRLNEDKTIYHYQSPQDAQNSANELKFICENGIAFDTNDFKKKTSSQVSKSTAKIWRGTEFEIIRTLGTDLSFERIKKYQIGTTDL